MIRTTLFIYALLIAGDVFAQNDLDCKPDASKRVQILEKQIPNEYTCYMELQRGLSSVNLGTGFLIHPRVVLTAGHNTAFFLFSKSFPFMFSRVHGVTLYFGSIDENRFTKKKFVKLKRNRSSFFKKAYWAKARITRDFSIIILPDDSVYEAVKGHYQIAPVKAADLSTLNITGSPRDKDEHTMWTSESSNFEVEDGFIRYDLFTLQRNSGSPIWIKTANGYRAVGVHSRGYGSCNAAVLIDEKTFSQIATWCKKAGISLTPDN